MKKILITALILLSLAGAKHAEAAYNTNINLSNQTIGVLPVSGGGTGATSLGPTIANTNNILNTVMPSRKVTTTSDI